MAPPTGVDLRMGPVWLLLLLLTPLLSAQVSIVSELGTTAESEDPTSSVVSATGESGTPYSPDPSGSVTTPSEALEEDWTPTEVFLYSGDDSVLEIVECDRAYSLTGQNGPLPRGFYGPLRPSMDALANTANFLNMILQASDLRESSVREDMDWYHAMVRALLEADPLIRQALLTFDADPASTAPQLVLRASRNPAPPRYQNILLQDLSSQWESLHLPAPAPDDTWFSSFKFPASSNQPTSALSKRVLLNDLSTLDTPKWGQGDSYVTNRSGVRWANGPFLECEDGRFLPGWLLTLSTSFYGLKPDLSPEFRGVIRVDVNVQGFDVNQCATGDAWFANTHQCNRTTMECEPITGQGFRLGQYCCRCKEGYYSPPMEEGGALNGSGGEGGGVCYPALPICLPCWPGCRRCEDGSPCWVEEDRFLRAGVLAVQGFFMLLVFISMLVAYQFRCSRRIRASGLLLLETILFGSLLLYFPVFIMYFKPSTFRCILLRWVRLLGFAIVYGTVTLKIYRVLKVFLSRTAQRVPYMSSIHLLRLLGVMVVTVSWFLCAWTAGVLQNRDRNVPLLIITTTSDGQGFSLCDLDRWDYMMAVAELMFLCWGSLLCSAVKPVPSAFHEPRYIGIAIHNELLLSSMFHLLRFVMPSLHPDWMLLLFFTHTHVTITVTLALLFIPKFLHVSRVGREEIAEEVYEDEVDLRRSGSYLNSSFTSAVWSDHSMDPDDIRDELKKLYGQLEVHKTKKMTANNPHLQKKRSSRRGLGRSIIKRITEIPESMSRQCSRDGKEVNLGSRDVTHSESCKRAPDTFSINYKDEPVKQPSPVLRKSQSDYDYVTDKDPSLHDSMLRANLAKRCSQRSETDSLDIAPLVCKSASAQNLTVDNNLLLPGPTKLHKSLSLASSKAHSLEDTYRGGRNTPGEQRQSQQDIAIKDQTSSALVQSQSYDKAEVCPWELAEERPANKNQPHVTFAPSEEEPQSPESISSPILKHICPWDHLPVPNPAESPAGDSQGGEADCESLRPQTPISTSVPGSPKAANDMRVFSFRTSTQKWLSVKSFVGSVDASIKEKAKKETAGDTVKKQDSISRKSQGSVAAIAVIAALKLKTPGTEAKSRSVSILEKKCGVSSVDKRTQQKRSMTTGDVKPVLVKQAAIRLSSSDSSERSPRRIVVVQSTVYPWDSEDMQKDSVYENVFISRENTAHSTAKTPSTHRRGSQIRPALSVSQSEICPWDVPASSQQAPQRQQSTTADICPWEVEEPEEDPKAPARVSVCPWESEGVFKRQESVRGDVCPWEADVSAIPITSASKQSEKKPEGLNKKARDVCPWETDETPQISHGLKPQKSVRVDVCPWDVGDSFPDKVKVPIIYENVNPQEDKGLRNAPPKCQETIHANVCPWESEETPKSQDGERENVCPWEPTDTASMGKQDVQTKSTEKAKSASEKLSVPLAKACPWEFPDPQKDLTVLCPWEEESTIPPITIKITKRSFSQETKTDICPWDIGDQEKTDGKDGPCTNVCPWETQGRTQADPKKTDSIRVNICPWETEKPEKTEQQDSSPAIVSIETGKTKRQDSLLADVCPWETGANDEPDKTKRRDGTQTDVGPWETEEPKKTEEKDGVKVDVCPWEPGETDKTNGQDSTEADISKETQKEKRRDSVQVNICPWETDVPEEPEKMKKQDSVGADVCVCETGPAEESENTQIQDSTKADICPWETRDPIEPEKIKKQESVREDVCSWETDEPEKSAEKEETILASGRQYVTETQGALSMEQGDAAEPAAGSPQGAEAAKANVPLARRDAMCPWEMEETKPPSSPSSITEHDNNSDIFTWDPENIPEEEEEEDDAESAAEAFVFPSDL